MTASDVMSHVTCSGPASIVFRQGMMCVCFCVCECVHMALFGFIARGTIICMDQWLAPTCGRRTKANRLSARGGTIQETAQVYLTSTRDKESKFTVFVSLTFCNAPEALNMEE